MHKNITLIFFLVSLLAFTTASPAEPISINTDDTIKNILSTQIGKRVSVKLRSGDELTGTVTTVTEELTYLSELAGKEFYDAVVVNNHVVAVIVRVK